MLSPVCDTRLAYEDSTASAFHFVTVAPNSDFSATMLVMPLLKEGHATTGPSILL
jgi:hypothetical protein